MSNKPLVRIILGSRSDEPTMQAAIDILNQFDVPFEWLISSAHRQPEQTHQYAASAEADGIQVIIAAAGMAAHLPGVLAAYTTLPIIGVPMPGSALNGVDALYSIVQMPGGVPVACMAIGKAGAKNAALMAIQILALSDARLKEQLHAYKEDLRQGKK